MKAIRLTRPQMDWLDWALDAMENFAYDEDCSYTPEELDVFRKTMVGTPDILEDLEYRLTEQAPNL